MAGYSATPLAKKLGVKANDRVRLLGAPDGLDATLSPLPEGAQMVQSGDGSFALQIVFARSRERLEEGLGESTVALPADGMVWLAWPKVSSGVPTDLTRDVVRSVGLGAGLIDVKVCAIDEV